ncbi:uncharacterized protein B0T15DRAFT_162491 [Chaetomium strumarium]|uniref:Uncharacterized protein n=1 Tax=Chaetomium strumarium TaxID=1170767 RepID=A0AAJ0M2X2_9PEZI|nr:hypothetical protein B0T15DRAFT_162491 [Chaetomium strumarium]
MPEYNQPGDPSLWADAPRPLHITKQSAQGRNSRCLNHESDASDGPMDSPPAPPGGNRSLTIPKRGDRDTDRYRKKGSKATEDTRPSTCTLSPFRASEGDARTLHAPRSTGPVPPIGSPSFPDPLVLIPRIIVTPEYQAVDEGASMLWAAVQLSTGGGRGHEMSSSDALRYGFLYDVSIDILPAAKSTILEVLGDKACKRAILYTGSRILLVVRVRLPPAVCSSAARTNSRRKPDELIEDLERHLGGTTTEYLHVHVSYRHSSFPERHTQPMGTRHTPESDGVDFLRTMIQTTATATIKRHNSESPWSPQPQTPRPNPLFTIMASH